MVYCLLWYFFSLTSLIHLIHYLLQRVAKVVPRVVGIVENSLGALDFQKWCLFVAFNVFGTWMNLIPFIFCSFVSFLRFLRSACRCGWGQSDWHAALFWGSTCSAACIGNCIGGEAVTLILLLYNALHTFSVFLESWHVMALQEQGFAWGWNRLQFAIVLSVSTLRCSIPKLQPSG